MQVRLRYLHKSWRKVKSDVLTSWLRRYRRCVTKLKKYLKDESHMEQERRKSHAKLQPLPDRPIRRVASKLSRKPTNEIERLRKKGDQWTANDLFRFQYSDPEEGTSEERRELCYAWLDRLHAISKKYCYLAWYEAAIYACYYRLAPILTDREEKRRIWTDVKREYAQVFLMGRRIWRRPSHPSRLRVFYDMAMLCVRFGNMPDDSTNLMFREALEDADNFDYRLLDEVQFAKSVDKIILLENHVIDQFYVRRRSSGSFRSSFRSKRTIERTPSRRSTCTMDRPLTPVGNSPAPVRSHDGQEVQRESAHEEPKITTLTYSVDNLLLNSEEHKPRNGPRKSLTVPFISVIEAEPKRCDEEPSTSQRIVHFSDEEASDTDA
ncbi:hypothetical protein Q1695_006311 [Nippostrongylus brasiliensis]|nr:hypothetical protein Q1695_006311 [Nippostrongylus brasiliensis]